MTNFYNNQYSKDALELFNQAAQVTVSNSLALWEQQVDYVKKSADRSLSRVFSLQKFNSPEEVLDFQRKASEAELAELKKAGENCYELANSANQEFISVAQKGRELMESSFGAAAEKVAEVLPNGKGVLFSETLQNSVKTANDFVQNGLEVAVQAARASVDSVVKGQQVVADAVQPGSKRKTGKR